jgi:hypothetical protein
VRAMAVATATTMTQCHDELCLAYMYSPNVEVCIVWNFRMTMLNLILCC